MVGIASKKLNFEATLLVKPNAKAAEIVIPDLDVPGIKAKHWAIPIINDCLGVIDSKFVYWLLTLVLRYRIKAKIIVA